MLRCVRVSCDLMIAVDLAILEQYLVYNLGFEDGRLINWD